MGLRNWRAIAASMAIFLAFILGGCDLFGTPAAPAPSSTPTAGAAHVRPSATPNTPPIAITPATAEVTLPSTPNAPSPAPSGVQACSAANLYATVDGQGCTGFFCGVITLTNTGQTTCSVHGRPKMEYISSDGKSISLPQYDMQGPTSGDANAVVMIKPGGKVWADFRVPNPENYCSPQDIFPISAALAMELPGIAGRLLLPGPGPGLSECKDNLHGLPSVEVGAFQAGD